MAMATFTVHQAKSDLSKLIARAEAGEEVVIARRDKPAVRLVPVEGAPKKRRVPGALAHLRGNMPADLFLTPMTEDELEAWEGKYSFNPR
jgi:prevent-host-death family protein